MAQVIIMRGIPGSGKSTRARELVEAHSGTATIRSTDNQFMIDGKYVFNPRLLGINHARNLELFESDIVEGIDLVIVDNTNIKKRDYAKYIEFALLHGYSVREEVVGHFDLSFVEACAKRNTHGVPYDAILRMAQNFED